MVRPFSDSKPIRPPVWSTAMAAGAAVLALVAVAVHQGRDPLPVSLPGVVQRPKAPAPPQQSTWISPLSRQCGVQDRTLRQRLQALQRDLPSRTRRVSIDPSNYGERTTRDAYGNNVDTTPSLVVLHETVYGIGSAINTFTTHHPHDQDQVSYHLLIGEDGQVVETLDPSKRAFGAGYSAFKGRWDVTNPNMDGSVNNFALHLSLETPLDGEDADSAHSGYSSLQYDALAVVLANWMRQYRIPFDHITTHRHVDLGGERADPRSFDWNALQVRLAALGALC
ncbi:MAG: N-acetylmuramoyl-L-alanine amidase [Cyanobacteria bacterium K_DeepCast_35m_m1_288]|nr:N-acetylmuramoyl-L-alanine amidase [Cyanobacteria bacterium K_DeepCast_35m_m1_288]